MNIVIIHIFFVTKKYLNNIPFTELLQTTFQNNMVKPYYIEDIHRVKNICFAEHYVLQNSCS